MRIVVMCLAVAFMACGPSSAEIAQAKTARYQGSPAELYAIAKQTAAQDYKIGEQDQVGLRFATAPQWYSEDGGRQSAGAGNLALVGDRSVMVSLVVEIITDADDRSVVTITPITFQYMTGSPKPRPLTADDPNLPPWIHGRVDALSMAIYKHAKGRQVR